MGEWCIYFDDMSQFHFHLKLTDLPVWFFLKILRQTGYGNPYWKTVSGKNELS